MSTHDARLYLWTLIIILAVLAFRFAERANASRRLRKMQRRPETRYRRATSSAGQSPRPVV